MKLYFCASCFPRRSERSFVQYRQNVLSMLFDFFRENYLQAAAKLRKFAFPVYNET